MPESSDSSRLLLAAIVDSSDDAILSKNLDGIITSWNRGAQKIFGYTAAETVGKSILMLIPVDMRQEEATILARLRRGEIIDHFETIRQTKEGRLVQVSITVSPIKDSEGRVIGASKIARDITQRKETETALAETRAQLQAHAVDLEKRVNERTEQLRRTISELEAFSYSLTHDLRAPLRTIQSYLEIYLQENAQKISLPHNELLQKVIGAAQRMDRMVLDLLAYTRLSHEEMPIEPVKVEAILRDLLEHRPELQAAQAGITLAGPLPLVMGNEASLTQCLTNLLDNAVKFVAPGTFPQVVVGAEIRQGRVRLYVQDNGIGISERDRAKLFRMFERGNGNVYPGTGIGLAIVRKAAERMGGVAGVESEPGTGSRFWLELNGVAS